MSSRSLIREINEVFESWDGAKDSPPVLSPETKKVFAQFIAKHTTPQGIGHSASINNELFRLYDTHIKPSFSLDKEILFLEVLTELVVVLTKKELLLWLTTYMKPSVDSSTYDIRFVEKARDFIRATYMDFNDDMDHLLAEHRREIAEQTIDLLIRIYCAHKGSLEGVDFDIETQVGQEHLRFVKLNCLTLIVDLCLRQPTAFWSVINKYVLSPDDRLDALFLVFSTESLLENTDLEKLSKHRIEKTPLLSTLLRCLLYDTNIDAISFALNVLVVMLPQMCTNIKAYVPDFFCVFVRLLEDDGKGAYENEVRKGINAANVGEWVQTNGKSKIDGTDTEGKLDGKVENDEGRLMHILEEKLTQIDAKLIQNNYESNVDRRSSVWTQTNGPSVEHHKPDYVFLGTLLYGLFPLNFSRFLQSRASWLKLFPPMVAKTEHVLLLPSKLFKVFTRDLMMHPKMFYFEQSAVSELEAPLSWIENISSPYDIAHSCYNLNTRLFSRFSGSESSGPCSRKSSIFKHPGSNTPVFADLRKKSIVDSISFKEIKFDGDSEKNDLFGSHEVLFGPKSAEVRPNSNIVDSADLGPLLSPKLAPSETALTLSNKETNGSSLNYRTGTALNFFEREILVLKNELGFVYYMFDMLKQKYSKLCAVVVEDELKNKAYQNTTLKLKSLRDAYEELLQTNKRLEEKCEASSKEVVLGEQFVNRVMTLEQDKSELVSTLEELKHEHDSCVHAMNKLVNDVIPARDVEISALKMKLKETDIKSFERVPESKSIDEKQEQADSLEPSAEEQKLFQAETHLKSLAEENIHLKQQLKQSRDAAEGMEKKLVKKLESMKLDISSSLGNMDVQHERKLQELNATIHKYESLLEEKNARILQLSSSKPILIPIAGQPFSRENSIDQNYAGRPLLLAMEMYDSLHSGRSNSSVDSVKLSGLQNIHHQSLSYFSPQHQNTTNSTPGPAPWMHSQQVRTPNNAVVSNVNAMQQPPTIRGRGGYQKRAKKVM